MGQYRELEVRVRNGVRATWRRGVKSVIADTITPLRHFAISPLLIQDTSS